MYPFTVYLQRRWDEGRHNAVQLTREIQPQGFAGLYWSARRRSRGDSEPP